jgi:hypothetical protein
MLEPLPGLRMNGPELEVPIAILEVFALLVIVYLLWDIRNEVREQGAAD